MILRLLPLILSVTILAPGLLHAQQQPSVKRARLVDDEVLPDNDKMCEDIEILRRILDRKLHGLYPTHTYTTFGMMGMNSGAMGLSWLGSQANFQGGGGYSQLGMQGGMGGLGGIVGVGGMRGGMDIAGGMIPVTKPLPSLEGVYLKGQGVVYTATLESLQSQAKTEKTQSAKQLQNYLQSAQAISEWESVRRQVRNEKEAPKKPEASKPPTLSDVLLRVLAENGHHFSQLSENESLTLVITVHEPNPPTPARKTGGSGSAKKSSTAQAIEALGAGSDIQDKVRDLGLLGDLHMKQGHYAEAITTYQKAVELKPDSNEAATLYRKLAQCYLNLGEDAKGRALLDQAISMRKKAEDEKDKPAPSKQTAVSLPVKLIISAPKKLLDEAKDGKLSFEEFRRRARVETLRFDNRR